jgi:hypothetical protein
MKKLIMIVLAATAFSCGDGNRSSERNDMDENDNTEQAAPDTTNTDEYGRQDSEMNEQDTTSTYDRNETDSLKNK